LSEKIGEKSVKTEAEICAAAKMIGIMNKRRNKENKKVALHRGKVA